MSRLYLPSMTMYKTALMGWTDTVYSRWCALLDQSGSTSIEYSSLSILIEPSSSHVPEQHV